MILQEFTVSMFFRQSWQDERLRFHSNITQNIATGRINEYWLPDLYFPLEKDTVVTNIPTANKMFYVQPNGSVFYSQK